MKRFGGSCGQALVEYVIIVSFCVIILIAEKELLLQAFNTMVQGIYYVLLSAYP